MKRRKRLVEDNEPALRVRDEHRVGHARQRRLERRLVLAQRAFRGPLVGDIGGDPTDPVDPTLRVSKGNVTD
ncbi:MAG: hypothetical protein ACLP0J_25465, partial [Solirubrobacteraceae bacterium]|jgi:hypothetical protein